MCTVYFFSHSFSFFLVVLANHTDAENALSRVQRYRETAAQAKVMDAQKTHLMWSLTIESAYESGRVAYLSFIFLSLSFSVHVCVCRALSFTDTNLHVESQQNTKGRLIFTDMCGSEHHEDPGLGSFADVVASLANGVRPEAIPYDQSAFTQLLAPTIGGMGRSLLVVTLAPLNARWHVTHNISALRFAGRVNTCDIGSAQARKAAVKAAAERRKAAGASASAARRSGKSDPKWGLDYN